MRWRHILVGSFGTAVTWGGAGVICCGGAGGGGYNRRGSAGGARTGAGLVPTVAGGAAGADNGDPGYSRMTPWLFTGGSGGGADDNGTGGIGGNGAYGSGGAGGGAGTTGGAGGRGGDGLLHDCVLLMLDMWHTPDAAVTKIFMYQVGATANAVWQPYIVPRGHSMVQVIAVGGGGGGGGGRSQTTAANRGGGGGGIRLQ